MFTIGSECTDQTRTKSEKEEEEVFHGRINIEVMAAHR